MSDTPTPSREAEKSLLDECDKILNMLRSCGGHWTRRRMVIYDALTRRDEKVKGLEAEVERLNKEISFLRESRSQWAKQSSENADEVDLLKNTIEQLKAQTGRM